MGKCNKCGKKIEYNNYKVIDGLVYCGKCAPKEAKIIVEVVEEKDEFETIMTETIEGRLSALLPNEPKKKRGRKKKDKNDN